MVTAYGIGNREKETKKGEQVVPIYTERHRKRNKVKVCGRNERESGLTNSPKEACNATSKYHHHHHHNHHHQEHLHQNIIIY